MKKLFTGRFENYSWGSFQKDLLSGLIVGVVAIPLGMSFAIASGVKPEYGIYTTFIAGILISLFGGSKFQIGGPTGAFVPILLGIVLTYGYEDLLVAGLMAGVILCLMGIFKLGTLIKFIPRPVTIGFTAGIAVIIFTGQISSFLGLTGLTKHELFIHNMKELYLHINTISYSSIIIATICLTTILLTNKYLPKVPGSLVGIIVSSIVTLVFFSGQIATIGTAYGAIPSSLPSFELPNISLEKMIQLIGPALVIAMLGGIESLLSAVVADGMTNTKHNSNKELIGQGIANIVTPMFGGIPATGAIARTATNIKSGAVSPMSGIIHGIFVLITLLLLAPYASHIPLASMAPILMVVAWNMSERKSFLHIMKLKSGDSLVLLTTFLLTVFTSLTTAVAVGLVLAIILFTKNMRDMLVVKKVLPDHSTKHEKVDHHIVTASHDCPQIKMYTIEGPLFFAAAEDFETHIMSTIRSYPQVLILRMESVPFMDTTGETAFKNVITNFQNNNGIVLLSEIQPKLLAYLVKDGLYDQIGSEHFFTHTGEAIDYALKQLDYPTCNGCTHFVFHECEILAREQVVQR